MLSVFHGVNVIIVNCIKCLPLVINAIKVLNLYKFEYSMYEQAICDLL